MPSHESLEAIRAGPALVAGLPGDEVDIDGLIAHLITRAFEGAIHITDHETEGLLWIYDGAAQDAWFFETTGTEAALANEPGREMIRQMAADGGMVSVLIASPPGAPSSSSNDVQWPPAEVHQSAPPSRIEGPLAEPPFEEPLVEAPPAPQPAQAGPVWIETPAVTPQIEPTRAAGRDVAREDAAPIVEALPTVPIIDAPAMDAPVIEALVPVEIEPPVPVVEPEPEPFVAEQLLTHPWPAILADIGARVARHRGQRLTERFLAALGDALVTHGGGLEEGGIAAPPLSEATWRAIVDVACAPVVAVAGRAFVDRTIAAAERHVAATAPPESPEAGELV